MGAYPIPPTSYYRGYCRPDADFTQDDADKVIEAEYRIIDEVVGLIEDQSEPRGSVPEVKPKED